MQANVRTNKNAKRNELSCCDKCCIGLGKFFCDYLFHLCSTALLCCGGYLFYAATCGFCCAKRSKTEQSNEARV